MSQPEHFEFPGLRMPGWPVFDSAPSPTTMRTWGGVEVVDFAMSFGAALFGHGRLEMSQDDVAAPGLGDLAAHRERHAATQGLCEWAAPYWGDSRPSTELRSVVLHTGSEAVETALKTALLATGRDRIVAFEGGYHGTFGLALAVTHGARFREPFSAQYGDTVTWTPFGEVPRLDESVACVIVEPVQGRAGVIFPPEEFLAGLRAACDDVGALLILDDVLVGCGRLGLDNPIPGAEVAPDMICLGKALGGGIAASALVATRQVAEAAWGSIDGEAIHTSTLIGDVKACLAIRVTLHRLEQSVSLPDWQSVLTPVAERLDAQLRGAGLLWCIDTGIVGRGVELAHELLARDVLVVPSGKDGTGITLYPSTAHDPADVRF